MSSDPRVSAVLARRDALCAAGERPTPEDLCGDCPELLDAVRAALAFDGTELAEGRGNASEPGEAAGSAVPGYELGAEVGRGGMGVVYRARDLGWTARSRSRCCAITSSRNPPWRRPLADAFEKIAWDLVDLWPKAAKTAAAKGNLGQLATATGIAVDKMRLLREQATQIHDSRLTDNERTARLSRLVEEYRAAVGTGCAPSTKSTVDATTGTADGGV